MRDLVPPTATERVVQGYVGPASLLSLLFGGLRLDQATYRKVAGAAGATHQCVGVALLGAVAVGMERAMALGFVAPLMVVVEMARTGLTLVIESAIVLAIGRLAVGRMLPFGQVLRPLALAGAPGILYLLVVLTGIQTPLWETVSLWLVLAFVVAVRAALECGWPLAAAVTIGVWATGWAMHEMLFRT